MCFCCAAFLSNVSISPISRPCTFPPAHWRLILLIHDFSFVIGGKLHSEYLAFSLLVANYSRNILFFLHWQPGCSLQVLQTHIICSLNIANNSLYNASYYMCRKITSHWQPLFSKKMAVASFSHKFGGGGLIFLQNWRRRQGFVKITGCCSDMVWILAISLLASVFSVSHPLFSSSSDLA